MADAIAKEQQQSQLQLCKFHDPLVMQNSEKFVMRESPIADKFFQMTRDDGASAASLKPNRKQLEWFDKISLQPDFLDLSAEENTMFWRFRHFCSSRKDLLAKFLFSVNWSVKNELTSAIELLRSWAEIDTAQALILISGFFSLNQEYTQLRKENVRTLTEEIKKAFVQIRKYGVQMLKAKTDAKTMLLIAPQLVQALRYEDYDSLTDQSRTGLKEFLFEFAMSNMRNFN